MKVWGFLTTSVTIRHFSLCSLSSVLTPLMHTSGLKGTNNPTDPVKYTYIHLPDEGLRCCIALWLYLLCVLQESTNLNFIFCDYWPVLCSEWGLSLPARVALLISLNNPGQSNPAATALLDADPNFPHIVLENGTDSDSLWNYTTAREQELSTLMLGLISRRGLGNPQEPTA